jgi:hypothetical protein
LAKPETHTSLRLSVCGGIVSGNRNIDLEHLDRYIVVPLTRQALNTYDDLRELDADFGAGIVGLWSDTEQSLVAFVFTQATWKKEDALQWVREAKANGAKALVASGATWVVHW